MRILICDDEGIVQQAIRFMIQKSFGDEFEIESAKNGRMAIELAESFRPDIILMDEPSAALDPQNRRNLIRVLNEFSYLKLIASHDLDFVWDTCDRTILLSEGRIVCDGDTREILSDRKLLETHGLELPLSLYRK